MVGFTVVPTLSDQTLMAVAQWRSPWSVAIEAHLCSFLLSMLACSLHAARGCRLPLGGSSPLPFSVELEGHVHDSD